MDLMQVTFELRHAEPLKLFTPHEELFKSLTGKDLPKKEMALPGFELTIDEKRMRIVVDPRHTAVVLGQIPNIGYCIDNIMAAIRKINELVKPPPLKRIGVRSCWVEEYRLSFDELVSTFKQRVFKSNELIEQSRDVGSSFILNDGQNKMHLSFGPMELSQLQTMLLFPPPDLPKVVTYIDVDYYTTLDKKVVELATVHEFVYNGLNNASKQAQNVIVILHQEM